MSEKNKNDSGKFFSQNPFQKRIIFEKTNKFGPIEQKLIIHHKKNVRKSLMYNSKEDFDRMNNHKEENSGSGKNGINGNDRKVIKVGNKEYKFDNLLLKKGEYPEEIRNQDIINNNGMRSQISNPFNKISNPFSNNNKDDNVKKGFIPDSQMFNPFLKNNNNEKNIFNNPPLPILTEEEKINKSNPFLNVLKNFNKNNTNDKKIINPFSNNQNITNPFINNESNIFGKNPFLISNDSNKEKLTNPFINTNDKKNKNPFITDNSSNPFININDKKNKNPFITDNSSNPFISNTNNLKNDSNSNEIPEDDEDDKNIEEEVKIEKDEDKLKNLKEVQYSKADKFYETEIQNLQFLEHEQGKNKYVSKGSGIFCFQEEKDEKGKKVGIFTLRESSTKNIKLQGIIIDSTSVEKSKLKNGLEFIFIKNILVKYSKYDPDKVTEETKITFLRIRTNKDEIDNFYNKTNEFFNLIKK